MLRVYFITGDEALLVGEAADAVRSAARAQGFTERETHVADAKFDWQALRAGLDNLSLFADKKLVEIRLQSGTPGREGSKALIDFLDHPPADTLLLISAPKVDKRSTTTKWAKAIEKQGVWVTVYTIPPDKLPSWLAHRMRAAGLAFDQEAVEVLASRVEGNLLAAQQEISKLALLADKHQVTADIVLKSVADGARFDVFQLADAAVGQDVRRAVRVLYGLRNEGTPAPLVLWALVRDANTLVSAWLRVQQGDPPARVMQELRIWRNRQGIFSRALRNHDAHSIRKLTAKSAGTDRVVKGARPGQPWEALLELSLLMASPKQANLNGYEA